MKTSFFILIFYFTSLYCYSETISFSADSMTGTVSEENNSTRLIGNANILTEGIELRADEIEILGDNYRMIVAKGSISGRYIEEDLEFSCDKLEYDRKLEQARLIGNVTMNDNDNKVSLKSEFLEYNQKTQIARIQIDVEIIKENSVCTAAFAIYRKKQQMLELNGSPKIMQKEDVFQSHEIIFNLDTEEITLIGKVQGKVTDGDGSNDNE